MNFLLALVKRIDPSANSNMTTPANIRSPQPKFSFKVGDTVTIPSGGAEWEGTWKIVDIISRSSGHAPQSGYIQNTKTGKNVKVRLSKLLKAPSTLSVSLGMMTDEDLNYMAMAILAELDERQMIADPIDLFSAVGRGFSRPRSDHTESN